MPPPVKIGELRDEVTIQAVTIVADKYGDQKETWADVATVPAEVVYVGGRESAVSQQLQAVANWRVRIRYRDGVTVAHRFLSGDKILTIADGGDPDGKRHELLFKCSELVDLAEAES